MFGGKKETGSAIQNQIGERDLLLKEQREWMKESECGKCGCSWGKKHLQSGAFKGEAGVIGGGISHLDWGREKLGENG